MHPRWLHVEYHHYQDKGHFEKLNHYRIIKWVVAAKLAPGSTIAILMPHRVEHYE